MKKILKASIEIKYKNKIFKVDNELIQNLMEIIQNDNTKQSRKEEAHCKEV